MELTLEMVQIIILVEGYTEKRFCEGVLKPYLQSRNIFPTINLIKTKTPVAGRDFEGGLNSYQQLYNHLQIYLKNSNPDMKLITTMIDLYQLPDTFPKYPESQFIIDAYQKVEFLEKALSDSLLNDRINIEKFLPYFQLHEFEAFMFVDSSKTLEKIHDAKADQIAKYQGVIKKYDNPELINTNKGPSVYMKEAFSELFQKSTIGTTIAENIGLNTLRNKCRHFHEWLEKLERISG